MKRLYRHSTNRIFLGILGGVGVYFNIDPALIRLIYVVIAILTGFIPAIFAYIVAIIIVPEPPENRGERDEE